jgi:hypothetical protein
MRAFAKKVLIAALAAAAPLLAQSMAEHAAGLTGATVGTAAGKSVSDGITSIFGHVDQAASLAAEPKPAKKAVGTPPVAIPFAPDRVADITARPMIPARPPAAPYVRRAERTRPAPEAPAALDAIALPPDEAPAKEPNLADFENVKTGAPGAEVLAALGAPAARITIPEQGRLLEIFRYSARGQLLGTIRLENGQVVSVEPAGEQHP